MSACRCFLLPSWLLEYKDKITSRSLLLNSCSEPWKGLVGASAIWVRTELLGMEGVLCQGSAAQEPHHLAPREGAVPGSWQQPRLGVAGGFCVSW